jgi:hypothetical protein
MPGFRVDLETLIEHGMKLETSEPFSALAGAARRIEGPRAPAASARAIERFVDRLTRELTDLATATGSLGRATRSAAAGYGEVEDSIRRLAGG